MKKILTSVVVILISVLALVGSFKVVYTALSLEMVDYSIEQYNQKPVKTNADTDRYLQDREYRQVNFYESEDLYVRCYSNATAVIKLTVIIAALLVAAAVIAFWYTAAKTLLRHLKRKMR